MCFQQRVWQLPRSAIEVSVHCRVLEWVKSFANERGLKHREDSVGNLVVYRPGSGGGEGAPPVVIQVLTSCRL